MLVDVTALEDFLNEVGKHVTPAKEPTLFAVGGRGYYENPASVLLAFFLKPKAEHRLGDLFLSTYLECMKEDPRRFNRNIKNDKIECQVKTNDGSYIDLQILGPDWCLIIENKINHRDANPFTSYENHAMWLGKQPMLFSILSRDGHSLSNNGKWVGVKYLDYCKALRQKMPEIDSYNALSKWQLFAREFILHMENELYNPPMNQEQADFVEQHADQFAKVQELATEYDKFIWEELKRQLEASVSGHTFNVKVETWGFRCSTLQWGMSDIVLLRGEDFKIRAYLYLEDISEPQQSSAMEALKFGPTGGGNAYRTWESVVGFDSRNKAIAKLCECAKILNNLLKKEKRL